MDWDIETKMQGQKTPVRGRSQSTMPGAAAGGPARSSRRVRHTHRVAHAPHWHRARRYASAAFCIYLAVLCVGVLEIVTQQYQASRYHLSADDQQLLGGAVSPTLAKKLAFDTAQQQYIFNADYQPQSDALDVGGAPYTATLPVQVKSGVSLTDPSSNLTITLKPHFASLPGRADTGRLIYPVDTAQATMVYTVKGNGLKEDIIVPSYQGDQLSFSYTLDLPAGTAAKLRPDGSIGIYRGDSVLFGDVSAASAKDQALLDKARANSPKTTLAFVIPAPTITQLKGASPARAAFSLHGSTLTIDVIGLQQADYPLSIDPSLALAGSDGWESGDTDTDNIDFSAGGQISRAAQTGGSVDTWGVGTNAQVETDFIYNGYGYNMWQCGANYEPLGADGAGFTPSGGAAATNAPCYANYGVGSAVAYNGYVYSLGGVNRSPDPCGGALQPSCTYTASDSVYYSKINTDGSLGVWKPAGSGATLVKHHQTGVAVAYNGYLYAYNTYNSTTANADTGTTEYAKINADGTLSAWVQSSTLSDPPTAAVGAGAVYNGYMYLVGGTAGSNSAGSNAVYYAPLSSQGVGTWQVASSLVSARAHNDAVAYRGYLYTAGGCATMSSGACDTNSGLLKSVEYAPIYASGSLGPWQVANAMNESNGRISPHIFGHGDYLYVNGGTYCSGAGGSCNTKTVYGDLQYAKLDPAGQTIGYTGGTSLNTARYYNTATAYNGHIYVTGGCTNNGGGYVSCTGTSSVEYATINSDGTLGSWVSTTSLPAARWGHAAAAYNGYLYITGGCTSTLGSCTEQDDTLRISINSSTGALGSSWTDDTTHTFPARREHQSVAYNGHLFVIGGYDSAQLNTIYTAPINSDGSIGAYVAQSNGPSINRLGAVAYGGYLYLADNSLIYYSQIGSDGVLGSWSTVSGGTSNDSSVTAVNGMLYSFRGQTVQTLPIASSGIPQTAFSNTANSVSRTGNVITSYNGYIYLVGGCGSVSGSTCNTALASTEYARVNNGGSGTTGAWTISTNQMTTGRADAGVTINNGYIYMIGGCTSNTDSKGSHCNGTTHTVEYAKIGSAGDIGSWSTATANISSAISYISVVSYNGYIYAIGGCTGYDVFAHTCNGTSNVISYAAPDASGNITGWTTSATTEPAGANGNLQFAPLAVTNGYLYLVAGTTTYYAAINPSTHDVGAWTPSSSALADGTDNLVTNGSYLYMIGGNPGGAGTAAATVQFAPINPDHSVGTWNYTSSLQSAGYEGINVAIANGYIYAIGGYGRTTNVEYAPLLANGALGLWEAGPTLSYSNRDSGGTNMVYNGYVYTAGGLVNNTSSLKTLQYASVQSIPRVAQYSKRFVTDKNVMPVNYYVTDTPESGGSGVTLSWATATTTSPVWTSLTTASTVSGTKYPVTISGDGVNYYMIFITIDDSNSATFGAETPTAINYFQLNYHPNPSMRLRGGQTFNANKLQGLDTP